MGFLAPDTPDEPEIPEFEPEEEEEDILQQAAPPPLERRGSLASIHAGPSAGREVTRVGKKLIGLG